MTVLPQQPRVRIRTGAEFYAEKDDLTIQLISLVQRHKAEWPVTIEALAETIRVVIGEMTRTAPDGARSAKKISRWAANLITRRGA